MIRLRKILVAAIAVFGLGVAYSQASYACTEFMPGVYSGNCLAPATIKINTTPNYNYQVKIQTSLNIEGAGVSAAPTPSNIAQHDVISSSSSTVYYNQIDRHAGRFATLTLTCTPKGAGVPTTVTYALSNGGNTPANNITVTPVSSNPPAGSNQYCDLSNLSYSVSGSTITFDTNTQVHCGSNMVPTSSNAATCKCVSENYTVDSQNPQQCVMKQYTTANLTFNVSNAANSLGNSNFTIMTTLASNTVGASATILEGATIKQSGQSLKLRFLNTTSGTVATIDGYCSTTNNPTSYQKVKLQVNYTKSADGGNGGTVTVTNVPQTPQPMTNTGKYQYCNMLFNGSSVINTTTSDNIQTATIPLQMEVAQHCPLNASGPNCTCDTGYILNSQGTCTSVATANRSVNVTLNLPEVDSISGQNVNLTVTNPINSTVKSSSASSKTINSLITPNQPGTYTVTCSDSTGNVQAGNGIKFDVKASGENVLVTPTAVAGSTSVPGTYCNLSLEEGGYAAQTLTEDTSSALYSGLFTLKATQQVVCSADKVLNSAKECVCKSGFIEQKGTCIAASSLPHTVTIDFTGNPVDVKLLSGSVNNSNISNNAAVFTLPSTLSSPVVLELSCTPAGGVSGDKVKLSIQNGESNGSLVITPSLLTSKQSVGKACNVSADNLNTKTLELNVGSVSYKTSYDITTNISNHCGDKMMLNASGQCVCSSGYIMQDGVCVNAPASTKLIINYSLSGSGVSLNYGAMGGSGFTSSIPGTHNVVTPVSSSGTITLTFPEGLPNSDYPQLFFSAEPQNNSTATMNSVAVNPYVQSGIVSASAFSTKQMSSACTVGSLCGTVSYKLSKIDVNETTKTSTYQLTLDGALEANCSGQNMQQSANKQSCICDTGYAMNATGDACTQIKSSADSATTVTVRLTVNPGIGFGACSNDSLKSVITINSFSSVNITSTPKTLSELQTSAIAGSPTASITLTFSNPGEFVELVLGYGPGNSINGLVNPPVLSIKYTGDGRISYQLHTDYIGSYCYSNNCGEIPLTAVPAPVRQGNNYIFNINTTGTPNCTAG